MIPVIVPLKVVKKPCSQMEETNVLPIYAKPGDAGCDGIANLEHSIVIYPGKRALVGLGISIALPKGFEVQVRPRSGWALKDGITVLNSPGTIDEGYRGEIGVILINHGDQPVTVKPGDRICQLVLKKFERAEFQVVQTLPESVRGVGGFGHTGMAQ